MKTIVLAGLCLFSLGAFAQKTTTATKKETKKEKVVTETKKSDAPKEVKAPITFKTMTIERTEIPFDSKEPWVFEFKNTGKEPLLITAVHTSCGCTAAEKPEGEIAKGKSSKIVVNYDTKRVGTFTKTITVTTNVSPDPVILTIKGTVLPAPVAEPEKVIEPVQN